MKFSLLAILSIEPIDLMVTGESSLAVTLHTRVLVLTYVSNSSEIVSRKIDLEEDNLIVMAVYHPPNNNLSYTETLCETIERVVLDHPNSVIYMDCWRSQST